MGQFRPFSYLRWYTGSQMATSFYFYDLETSGVSAKNARIMQFAGQRTDLNLVPLGEPDNIIIKLTDDILPEPDAILITGITPQSTLADGITEAEFLRYFQERIAVPDTIFVGFNNVRFDDEFMRYTLYRNFYDPYEWCWKNGCGRWDLLDVIRMTRALRPDGIKWPFASDGKPTNRLELLTSLNGLSHEHAHDALSDVHATIAVARLIRNKQQKLFDYLLSMRDKNKVKELAEGGQPFVYTSGKYPSAYEKTTVVATLGEHPGKQGILVYDLRRSPEEFKSMSPEQMAEQWMRREEDETKRFPVKTLQYNRCPAVAPLGVLDETSKERIKIDLDAVARNFKVLQGQKDLHARLVKALSLLDKQRQSQFFVDEQDVDGQLYDGFVGDQDKTAMSVVRAADSSDIPTLTMDFKDERLKKLLPLYKARNFKQLLSNEEREAWERFRYHKLMSGGAKSAANRFFTRLSELAERPNLSSEQQYLLQELQLYGESVIPAFDEA